VRDGLRRAAGLAGRRFDHDRDWLDVAPRYAAALDSLTRAERPAA
jgi:hypothetical protein